jgi:hypothetical protein
MENDGAIGASAPEQASKTTIDWSKVSAEDIPADLVKQTGLYKGVLTESIERRQELSKLREQPAAPAQKPTPTGEMPDPVREALDRVAKLEQSLAEERAKSWRVQAAKEAQLPDNLAKRLVGDTYEDVLADAKSIAEALPKPTAGQSAPPASTTPGNAAGEERDTTMLNRITSRMGSNFGVTSPFDPGIQRQAGGGGRS